MTLLKPGEVVRVYITVSNYFDVKNDGWSVNISSNMAEIGPRYNRDGSIQVVAYSDEITDELLGEN